MRLHTPLAIITAFVCISQLKTQAQMPVTKVVVTEAQMREAPTSLTLVGTVNASRISKISSEIAGIVHQLPIRQGDDVELNQGICQLNDDALALRLDEEKATLASLQARHDELVAGTRKEELQRLKALLDETSADFDRWKFEMERIDKLYENKDSNHKEYFDTRANFLSAERRKIAAQALYDEAVAGPRKEVIAQAAHTAAAQKAIVDRLQSDLTKTMIRAPFSGVVTQRLTEVGQWISAGGPIVELAELQTVLVRIDAPESAFRYLTVGDQAHVYVDALQKSFMGAIKHIIPQADANARTMPVEIEVDNKNRALAVGMFARVTITAGEKEKVVAIPKDAIVERDGISYVALVIPAKDGFAGILQAVTVGADIQNWIAVTSGNIKPGMQIITHGNERIFPFPTPIVVVDDHGTPVALPSGGKPVTPSDPKHDREG